MHGQAHQKARCHERLRKHVHPVLGLHEFLLPPWHEFLALRPEPIVPRGVIGPSSCPTMPVPNEVTVAVDDPGAKQMGAPQVAKILEGQVIGCEGRGAMGNVSRYW